MANEVDPRILFAAERTLLAWVRTGLTLMGFGFVVARFAIILREISGKIPAGESRLSVWMGTFLVALGAAINVYAAADHCKTIQRLKRNEPIEPRRLSAATVLAVAIGFVGVLLMISFFNI